MSSPIHASEQAPTDLHISLIGRRNLAREIYGQLRTAIAEGRLHVGQSLPPTRELAARLCVARTTVTAAYERLIGEGLLHTRVGAGTYVAFRPAPLPTQKTPRAPALQPGAEWASLRLPTAIWVNAEYDFRAGLPDASLFPRQTWSRLLARESRNRAARCGYPHPAGHPELREAIARHVGAARGLQVDADDVIVTSGAQQAIDLIARVLAARGDRAAVEDPGYGPPRRLLSTHGLEICGTPVDAEGLIVDALPARCRLVYVTPSHQFPLGMSMSLQRRIALLEWAERNDCAIVEDDYDSEFRFGDRPIEPLHTLDRSGRVVYVGSFSKTLLPSLRLGFMVAPRGVRDALISAKFLADWSSPLATQAALARFMTEGSFARHVRRMRATYAIRRRVLTEAINDQFSDDLQILPAHVGLHIAARARCADVERVAQVVKHAAQLGLQCTPLSMYAAGAQRQSGFVLGYGAIAAERIAAGAALLRRAYDASART